MGKFYTCKEVAESYGVKVATVRSWVRNGLLGAIKLQKGYRIREQDLEEYEAKNSNK